MITKRVIIISILLVVLLGLSLYVIYSACYTQNFQQRYGLLERTYVEKKLYASLGLTDGQKKLLEENKKKHREEARVLFVQMRERMDLIRQELQKEQLDTEKILQANNELKKLQAQMLDERIEGILSVRKILTPEQFKKFMAKTGEWGSHFRRKSEWTKERLQ